MDCGWTRGSRSREAKGQQVRDAQQVREIIKTPKSETAKKRWRQGEDVYPPHDHVAVCLSFSPRF